MTIDARAEEALNTPAFEEEDLDGFDESALDNEEVAVADEQAETSDDEPEVAAEAEAPADADDEGKAEHEAKARDSMIPRHRYNHQKERREALERENQQLRSMLRQAPAQEAPAKVDTSILEAQVVALDDKITQARLDGDSKEVTQLRAQQRALERQILIAELPTPQQVPQIDPREIMRGAAESVRLDATITQLEQQFPMLDEENEAFDAELSGEVMTLYEALSRTLTPTSAMRQAVNYVTRAHSIEAIGSAPIPRKTNVKRNIDAANATPPNISGVGRNSNAAGAQRTLDVMKMTQDEFESLSDAEVDRLLEGTNGG